MPHARTFILAEGRQLHLSATQLSTMNVRTMRGFARVRINYADSIESHIKCSQARQGFLCRIRDGHAARGDPQPSLRRTRDAFPQTVWTMLAPPPWRRLATLGQRR